VSRSDPELGGDPRHSNRRVDPVGAPDNINGADPFETGVLLIAVAELDLGSDLVVPVDRQVLPREGVLVRFPLTVRLGQQCRGISVASPRPIDDFVDYALEGGLQILPDDLKT
jgi:hypothetical protein